MPLAKPTRRLLVIVGLACLIFIAPFGLMVASNLGAGVLSSILDRRPTMNELIGSYEYRASWGLASLELRQDGTFREQIDERGRATRVISGFWSTFADDNYADVTFKPFGMVWDNDHESQTQGFRTQFYKPRRGKTYGVINDDLGEKFEQQ